MLPDKSPLTRQAASSWEATSATRPGGSCRTCLRSWKRSGSCLANVVKATVFLADIEEFKEFDRTYREFFPGEPPARSTFGVSLVGPLGVEIEVIAVVNEVKDAE